MYNILEGDGNIKNICLKFHGLGYGNSYQCLVRVYDVGGNLINQGFTYDGMINFNLCVNQGYRISAIFLNEIINEYFYVSSLHDCYTFAFPHVIVMMKTVNFLLTDYYYDNLPIERGNILLWQK